ncbi:ASCH domain-containing protein [Dendronalium sp. ChiSLP03b]|uniref:ASCH domain-containing protein n=1 Tax=Dendronalium sp. ChiSLP03b TaxID=3075381 RepID=UPI00391BABA9
MKAISLWQPWASLIAMGLKQYETRSWRTNYQGPLLICSAQRNYPEQQQIYADIFYKYQQVFAESDNWLMWDELPRGYAIALVELAGCIKMDEAFIQARSQLEIDCGEWSVGRYAWRLENVRKTIVPIKVRGRQGLFNLEVDIKEEDLEEVSDVRF